MRIGAKATWENALPWQDDDIRGGHVPILYDLLPGRTFEHATDTWISHLGRWQICFDWRIWEEKWTVAHHYCTFADDPIPPVYPTFHYLSECPGVPYPDEMATTTFNTGPDPCDCVTLSFLAISWNAGIGPWGGWTGTNTSCAGGGITLTVYPILHVGALITWVCEIAYPGGTGIGVVAVECGQRMLFEGITIQPAGCPVVPVDVIVNWPGADG